MLFGSIRKECSPGESDAQGESLPVLSVPDGVQAKPFQPHFDCVTRLQGEHATSAQNFRMGTPKNVLDDKIKALRGSVLRRLVVSKIFGSSAQDQKCF